MLDLPSLLPTRTGRLVAALILAMGDAGAGPPPDRDRSFGSGTAVDGARSERVHALVELAQRGDSEAFGALYEEYAGLVYRYAFLRTHDRQAAEDLTSETFLRALRRIDTFVWQGRDIATWFLTITRNLILDTAKSSVFRLEVSTAYLPERPAEDTGSPETRALDQEQAEWVMGGLRAITPDQAECLMLRFMEGLTLAECAQVLGRSENAVKQLQWRALRALRRELGDAP